MIAAYDPAAVKRAREVLGEHRDTSKDAYEAAEDADALLILTEWEEFAALDLSAASAVEISYRDRRPQSL